MWFLTQQKRWGLFDAHPDYLALAQQINQVELYRQAASTLNINVLSDSVAYTDGFKVCASPQPVACAA